MSVFEKMKIVEHNLIGEKVVDLYRSKRGEIRGIMMDLELLLLVAWIIEETTEITEYRLNFESINNVVLIREV